MTKYDGGPAFPVSWPSAVPDIGMSLRDYFANNAPSSYLECDGWTIGECAAFIGVEKYIYREHYQILIAKLSYEYADAMLAERAKATS